MSTVWLVLAVISFGVMVAGLIGTVYYLIRLVQLLRRRDDK